MENMLSPRLLCLLALPVLLLTGGTGGHTFNRKLSRDLRAEHALDRLAFGARPGDVERVRRMGLDKWIDEQLHPERIAPNPLLAERLKPLETLSLSIAQVAEQYPLRAGVKTKKDPAAATGKSLRDLLSPAEIRQLRQGTPGEKLAFLESLDAEKRTAVLSTLPLALRRPLLAAGSPALRREVLALGNPVAIVGADLVEAKIYRALYSDRQLEEVLVDFWFNHFNVYMNKGPERLMVAAYERDAVRPFVLGKFSDMLLATAKHPAMLFYLDNWQSVDPKAMEAMEKRRRGNGGGGGNNKPLTKRARGLNENYARELMELHTLGVDGGFTQQDVIDVARSFTGWTLLNPRRGASYTFAARLHDQTEKVVLGHKIAAGRGQEDGLEVLSILAKHPSTARFLSRKLAQRFVADQPPQALVDRMAATFTKTQGDLREVMKTMIGSPEFFSEGAHRAKLKSPFELVVSAARALDANVTGALPLSARIEALGQPLYRKEEPTGYYDTAGEWTNTAGLLARMNFATALASNQLQGSKVDASRYSPPAALRAAIASQIEGRQPTPEIIAGLALGSPEFQRR